MGGRYLIGLLMQLTLDWWKETTSELWIQCCMIGTNIFKIDWEMAEKNVLTVGNRGNRQKKTIHCIGACRHTAFALSNKVQIDQWISGARFLHIFYLNLCSTLRIPMNFKWKRMKAIFPISSIIIKVLGGNKTWKDHWKCKIKYNCSKSSQMNNDKDCPTLTVVVGCCVATCVQRQ